MYGLVHRALQCFAQDTYSDAFWQRVAEDSGVGCHSFESMLSYPDHYLDDVLNALSSALVKPPDQVAEDVGAYLVTHHRMDPVRRLLRFGGATFEDFVLSLDDLHDRVKLALPDLDLPQLEVEAHSRSSFSVHVSFEQSGFGAVLLGILRALADDYGALVMLELFPKSSSGRQAERVTVEVFEAEFASDRGFGLVATEGVK